MTMFWPFRVSPFLPSLVSDHDSNTGDLWGDAPTPAPNLAPQMASTAIKRRRMDEESIGAPSEPGSEQDFQDS